MFALSNLPPIPPPPVVCVCVCDVWMCVMCMWCVCCVMYVCVWCVCARVRVCVCVWVRACVVGIKPRALCALSRNSTTEPHPKYRMVVFKAVYKGRGRTRHRCVVTILAPPLPHHPPFRLLTLLVSGLHSISSFGAQKREMSCIGRELTACHCLWVKTSVSNLVSPRTALLTFNIMVDHFFGVQKIESLENVLRHPNNFKFSHGPTALQLFQNGTSLACFHEEMNSITP